MAKKTYVAELNGFKVTRKTDRTYTHAVLNPHDDGTAGCIGFCGRLDLAQKLKSKWDWAYPNTVIVECKEGDA